MFDRAIPSREQVLAVLPLEVQRVLDDFHRGMVSAGKLTATLDAAFATAVPPTARTPRPQPKGPKRARKPRAQSSDARVRVQ